MFSLIRGSSGKEDYMDEMTNEQYADNKKTLILYIIEMMKNSADLNEAIEKVEALLDKE